MFLNWFAVYAVYAVFRPWVWAGHSGRFELDIPFMYWIERGTEDVDIHLKYRTHRPV